MKYAYHLKTLSAITGVLIFFPGADLFAFGRGGGASRCSAGAYGSVHQSAYHSASASGGEAGYSREATGSGGKTLSSTGSETHGGGEASYNREVSGSGGKSADVSGSATYGGGQASASREATTSGGKSASSSGSATYGGGQASASREATGPNGGTAYSHGSAHYAGGQVNATHAAGVTGSQGYSAVHVGSTVTTLPAGGSTVA